MLERVVEHVPEPCAFDWIAGLQSRTESDAAPTEEAEQPACTSPSKLAKRLSVAGFVVDADRVLKAQAAKQASKPPAVVQDVVLEMDGSKAEHEPPCLLESGEEHDIESAKAVEDLSLLPSSLEPEVLNLLCLRYLGHNIYTFAGPVLVAVNPCQDIPVLHSDEQLHEFAHLPHGFPAPMPHIFGIGRDALLGIQYSKTSQTVVISGESGSGKTEAAKHVIRFLALSGCRRITAEAVCMEHRVLRCDPLLETFGNASTLKHQNASRFGKFMELHFQETPTSLGPCIVGATTVTYLLETTRITGLKEGERCFHIFYQVLAAAVRSRSRRSFLKTSPLKVAALQFPTRVKHSGMSNVDWDDDHDHWQVTWTAGSEECIKIFKPSSFAQPEITYNVDNAEDAALKAAVAFRNELVGRGLIEASQIQLSPSLPDLMLPDIYRWTPGEFAILARSSSEDLHGVDEAGQFDQTIEAMKAFRMTEDEITQVVGAIVAVLLLSNVEFLCSPGEPETSQVKDCEDVHGPLSLASALLGVESTNLATALCTRGLAVPHDQSTKMPRTASQAAAFRDALAAHLYGLVFKYIVSRINGALWRCPSPDRHRVHESKLLPTIGVLDMFGLEVLEQNNFEQFWINFANEVMQQHLTTVIFEKEMALLAEEALVHDPNEVAAREEIAQRHLGSPGVLPSLANVFSLLDDECNSDAGTCESWLDKIALSMSYSSGNAVELAHERKGHFKVHHFAGPAEYCVDDFLTKNKDFSQVEACKCMQGSSKAVLRQLFANRRRSFGHQLSACGRRAKNRSMLSDSRDQFERLMKKIQSSRSHIIQCLKPNQDCRAASFDSCYVLDQLQHQGVLDAARVARTGFALRLCHKQAVLNYWTLAPKSLRWQLDEHIQQKNFSEAAQALFAYLQKELPGIAADGIQVGRTLTFFTAAALDILVRHVGKQREGSALQMQTMWRRHQCERRFAAFSSAVLRIQAWWRGKQHRILFCQVVKAVLLVQRWYIMRVVGRRCTSDAIPSECMSLRVFDPVPEPAHGNSCIPAFLEDAWALPSGSPSEGSAISEVISSIEHAIEQASCTSVHAACNSRTSEPHAPCNSQTSEPDARCFSRRSIDDSIMEEESASDILASDIRARNVKLEELASDIHPETSDNEGSESEDCGDWDSPVPPESSWTLQEWHPSRHIPISVRSVGAQSSSWWPSFLCSISERHCDPHGVWDEPLSSCTAQTSSVKRNSFPL